MTGKGSTARGNRGGLIATAITALFLVSGSGLMGVAIASQREAPPVPRAAPASGTDLEGVLDPYESWWAPSAVADPAAPYEPLEEAAPLTLPRSKPVALEIPSIGVVSVINHLGQADDGSLETPAPGPDYNEAAWYRYSPTPGSLGPAILLGHVDSAAEGPSVFYRLGELEPGDHVSVTRADGSIAVFIVDNVRRYSKDDFPTEVVYGDIDHAGLRILTCGGAFDNSTGHYLDNIVVFASLEGASPKK